MFLSGSSLSVASTLNKVSILPTIAIVIATIQTLILANAEKSGNLIRFLKSQAFNSSGKPTSCSLANPKVLTESFKLLLNKYFNNNGIHSIHDSKWWYYDKKIINGCTAFTDGYEHYNDKRVFPNLELFLYNLFETLKDISLFIGDLL